MKIKTLLQSNTDNKSAKKFEKEVCANLLIDPKLFDRCVHLHKGYAFLLRNWIRESYESGNTVKEVVHMIRNSKLQLDAIKVGQPLSLVA